MTKSKLVAISLASFVSLAPAAFAADEVNVSNGLTLTGMPLGLHGFGPVSMFKADAPQIGNAAFTSTFDGGDYYFARAEAQTAFDADPAAMLPQFGGFCAFGVYADMVDGKLYLFVNKVIFDKYLEDWETVITGAFAKWRRFRPPRSAILPPDLFRTLTKRATSGPCRPFRCTILCLAKACVLPYVVPEPADATGRGTADGHHCVGVAAFGSDHHHVLPWPDACGFSANLAKTARCACR